MIDVFTYRNVIKRVKLGSPLKDMTWIRIINPDPEKIKLLSENTGLPMEELQESLEDEERPRISQEAYLEIIYRAPSMVGDELETLPIYFYLLDNKIITMEKKPLKVLDIISENMSKNKFKFLFKKGLGYFVFYVMDKINDNFLWQVDKIASRIDIYENFSKKEMTIKDIEKIYDQSVTLSFFNQALIANVEVLNALRKDYFRFLPRKDKTLFEELYFDILQILDTEKIQREVLTNLINVHSIITTTRLNEFMKRLTTIALIVAIPTMLSGIYGMNFSFIPLATHEFGFYIVSALMILITLGFYISFKRSKWL